jgi:hypothetical protein
LLVMVGSFLSFLELLHAMSSHDTTDHYQL